jgi:hypothetical protein
MGEEGKSEITIRIGDPAAKVHELLSARFEKIASGGFFSTAKNNREVTSTSSGYCRQYRIRKGERSLIFVTAQKDGKIVGLASTHDDLPLEFDSIPWVKATKAKIDPTGLRVTWMSPQK